LASSSESFSYVLRPRLALQRPVLYLNDCPSEQSFFDCPVVNSLPERARCIHVTLWHEREGIAALGLVPSLERQVKWLPFPELIDMPEHPFPSRNCGKPYRETSGERDVQSPLRRAVRDLSGLCVVAESPR